MYPVAGIRVIQVTLRATVTSLSSWFPQMWTDCCETVCTLTLSQTVSVGQL